jgi:hypothetical protein
MESFYVSYGDATLEYDFITAYSRAASPLEAWNLPRRYVRQQTWRFTNVS